MDSKLQEIYVKQLRVQCQFALMASADANFYYGELAKADMEKHKENMMRFWFSLQSFLAYTANVSKFLWPVEEAETRGKELRELLSIPLDSPLRSKAARNKLEHFDEKLDRWARSAAPDYNGFTDFNIGPSEMHAALERMVGKELQLRNFDSEKLAFTFFGEEYPLRPLIEALHGLNESIENLYGPL